MCVCVRAPVCKIACVCVCVCVLCHHFVCVSLCVFSCRVCVSPPPVQSVAVELRQPYAPSEVPPSVQAQSGDVIEAARVCASASQFVMFVEDDFLPCPGALPQAVRVMQVRQPECGSVCVLRVSHVWFRVFLIERVRDNLCVSVCVRRTRWIVTRRAPRHPSAVW